MSDNIEERAKILLEAKQFPEAGKLFRKLWEENNSAYAASKYLYCLRKAGYPEASIQQGIKADTQFPGNKYIKSELTWAHYDLIKIAIERGNLSEVLAKANQLLDIHPEILALELTVFAIIKLAKKLDEWEIVSWWCDQIDPAKLSDNKPQIGDQNGMSKKEQWYFAKVKSLIELKSWQASHIVALEATKIYPKQIHFLRWNALALGHLGQTEEAINLLKELLLKYREEWYIWADLSDLYTEIKQPELALVSACKAALSPGEDKVKITLYQNLARMALSMNKLEMAARHIQLCKVVRQRENWRIKSDLVQLELNVQDAFRKDKLNWVDESGNIDNLMKNCRQHWQEESYQGLPRQKGVIESLVPDKPYGWIRAENGNKVFFLQKELPKFLRKENLKVNFAIEESWDNAKGKLSVKAVNIKVENR